MAVYSFFIPNALCDVNCDWTIAQSEPKYEGSIPQVQTGVSGVEYMFTAVLTPSEEAAVNAIIAGGPLTWLPAGSVSKTALPVGETPGVRLLWVFDAVREGGGTGCFAYWDAANWRRVSDNAVVT
jgi:hypothetical protein